MKKSRDPYPIVNTYHVAYNLVKELGINVGYGYYGKSAEDILEDRKKKKNETAN